MRNSFYERHGYGNVQRFRVLAGSRGVSRRVFAFEYERKLDEVPGNA